MELPVKLAAATPLNGEVMIGVGAPVVNGHEDLVCPRIVMYGPESVRLRNGGGRDREGQNDHWKGDPVPLPRACAHVRTSRLTGPDILRSNPGR